MKLLVGLYVAAMVTANLLVWWFGPWFSPINSFLLIGLDLTLRDVLHDRLTKWQMLGVILAGGAITWAANPSAAHIAIASATAFGLSALADWATYAKLRARSWFVRSNGSNIVGAAVDSLVFPTLAFSLLAANPKPAAVLMSIIGLQFVAKVFGGALWSTIASFFMSRKVYLCGPINGRSDDDCKGWREYAKERLTATVDPMARDYRGRELDPGISREIVENDKRDIDACDALLVFYDKPSVGTSMEILYSWDRRKRIVVVNKSDKPLSPWLVYHASEVYSDLDTAIAALK